MREKVKVKRKKTDASLVHIIDSILTHLFVPSANIDHIQYILNPKRASTSFLKAACGGLYVEKEIGNIILNGIYAYNLRETSKLGSFKLSLPKNKTKTNRIKIENIGTWDIHINGVLYKNSNQVNISVKKFKHLKLQAWLHPDIPIFNLLSFDISYNLNGFHLRAGFDYTAQPLEVILK